MKSYNIQKTVLYFNDKFNIDYKIINRLFKVKLFNFLERILNDLKLHITINLIKKITLRNL